MWRERPWRRLSNYRFLSTAKRCTGVPRKQNGKFLLAATVAVLMYQAIVTFVDTGHTIIKYCTCTYDKKIILLKYDLQKYVSFMLGSGKDRKAVHCSTVEIVEKIAR